MRRTCCGLVAAIALAGLLSGTLATHAAARTACLPMPGPFQVEGDPFCTKVRGAAPWPEWAEPVPDFSGPWDAARSARNLTAMRWREYVYPFFSAHAKASGCYAPGGRVDRPSRGDPRGVSPRAPNPLKGARFYIDPSEPAWMLWRRTWLKYPKRAARLWRLASQPKFRWFGAFTPALEKNLRGYFNCVDLMSPGSVPFMAVMRAESKECHRRYQGGGRAQDRETRRWYKRFAQGVGTRRVVIAFEPDSLGTIDCLARKRRKARLRTLRYGVKVLSKLPNATIYLEGGASDWEPARRTARMLRYIGIRRVRGFMLNVTHYAWTADNIRYGRKVSRLVGGKHFVISTAYNGRGPVHLKRRIRGRQRRLNVWCHPRRRGLGRAPTTSTGKAKVDAYLWIGRPGYSAGSCNGGPLPIGRFWTKRAYMFTKYATRWVRPPARTRFGLRRRYTLRQLGYCGLRCT